MYIEDIIDKVSGYGAWMIQKPAVPFSLYDSTMLNSFAEQLNRGSGLTEKQALAAERILANYQSEISRFLSVDVEPFLIKPTYRLGKRVLNQDKSITVVEVEPSKKIIRVTFPYEEKLVEHIKRYRTEYVKHRAITNGFTFNTSIAWNSTTRSWEFEFKEEHLHWILSNFSEKNFEIDQELVHYFKEMQEIEADITKYVPMVVFEENSFKFVNVHKNIPQPTSTDVLQVLFDAKKYGISTWDDNIEAALSDKSINHFTRKVLSENLGENLPKNGEKLTSSDLADMLHYMGTILVTIPGGSELESLKYFHGLLKEQGYAEEQMSVLFRLDSSSGTMCNEFVKSNKLNNPIDEKIKIFFISGKVPKPLISSSVVIDAIINLGSNSAHYTQKNMVKNHHCVINYTITKDRWDKVYAGV